jgi:hypothetical protein
MKTNIRNQNSPVDKAIAAFDVEPFDYTSYLHS